MVLVRQLQACAAVGGKVKKKKKKKLIGTSGTVGEMVDTSRQNVLAGAIWWVA
jgi:hypothetical protein